MNALPLLARLTRFSAWLAAYILLAIGQERFAYWTVARLQHRPIHTLPFRPNVQIRTDPLDLAAALIGLLSASFIPLANEIPIGTGLVPLHLLAGAEAGLLLSLTANWISIGLQAVSERQRGSDPAAAQHAIGATLSCVLPGILIMASLAITIGTGDAVGEGSLSLTRLVEFQGGWRGTRWLCLSQPLACLLWLACLTLPRPAAQQGMTLAWQITTLNCALLGSAMFFGGWQGTFAERIPWLGLLYTALKVGGITFVRVWVQASTARVDIERTARMVYRTYVPLALLNLVLTTGIVLLR
jgi:hypothetical protein